MKKLIVGLLSLTLMGGPASVAAFAAETKPAAESETPRRLPNSITEAVLEKNKGGGGHPTGATAAPETKG